MALEQLSLGPATAGVGTDGAANGVETRHASVDGADDGSKVPRLPRWTRQEILVLIQGKKVAENRVRRGRSSGTAAGSVQTESKWAAVSGYCKRHGVNRGPVQCRKRWSNLAGDYKKIKEWESRIKDESESFWVMRNDLRRERKLPGFFDREVYDILEGGPSNSVVVAGPGLDLVLAPATAQEVETEVLFDGVRAGTVEDGLFSDFEQEDGAGGSPEKEKEVPTPVSAVAAEEAAGAEPVSEKQYQPDIHGGQKQGNMNGEQPFSNPELGSTSQEARKRRRLSPESQDEAPTTLQHHLIDALERNGNLLLAQLEAQNSNSQLDREQRKDQADGLLSILNKLADALVRIADKL